MQATFPQSFTRIFAFVIPTLLLAGCFGEGTGPTRIPGTPAPPPPEIPDGFCDPINFEDVCGPVEFLNFGGTATGAGGIATIIDNPDARGINTSEKVARLQKFAGEVFAGSAIQLNQSIDFTQGQAFTMKVWASRSVPVLFKLEDAASGDPNLGKERTANHSGSGSWEQFCFEFSGDVNGFLSDRITLIFDLGVAGNAGTNPNAWTFYVDDITQVANCGEGGGPTVLPVDFEGAGPYVFDDFEGGVASVIANPVAGGINNSAQVARMQKFAGEVFAGSTLRLSGPIDFTAGPAFKVKVWSPRPVPVLFKLEGLDQERSVNHAGGNEWRELCFDFTGSTSGPASSAITFIFDLGTAGNAGVDPGNWTFYFDDITQVAACDETPPPPAGEFPTITFDDPAVTYTLTDFGGNVSERAADPTGGSNQVARVLKTAGAETWAGTTVSTLANQAVPAIPFTATDTQMTVRVYSPDAGIPVRVKVENANNPTLSVETEATTTVANTWETLTFDFANHVADTAPLDLSTTYNKLSIFFNFGTAGTGRTYYFDDVAFDSDAPPPPPPPPPGDGVSIDFDGAGPFTFNDFEGGVATVIDNPVPGGLNTSARVARMQKFAGAVFAGSTLPLASPVDFSKGPAFTLLVWSEPVWDFWTSR